MRPKSWKSVNFANVEAYGQLELLIKKQMYRCKNCNKNQAKMEGRINYSEEKHKHAVVYLYLEECEFRRIARIMSKLFGKIYRHQGIMNWIKVAVLQILSAKTKS